MKLELKKYLSLFVLVSLLIFCAGASLVIYKSARDGIAKDFESRMCGVGELVSSFAEIEDLNEIMKLDEVTSKESKLYKKYHTPLRKVLLETGASFLYMYKFGGEKDILYCLDAEDVENEIWAAPNVSESFADEDLKLGLFSAFRNKGNVTEILDSQEWGFMRSGAYPVSGKNERSLFMTGVDFNLSEIVIRSAEVFTKLGIVFALIAIFGLQIASKLALSISNSVNKVRVEVLKMGAGKYKDFDIKNSPYELQKLAFKIQNYVRLSQSEFDNVECKRKELSKEMLLCFLNSKNSLFDSVYSFEPSKQCLKNGVVASGIFSSNKFYFFSFEASENRYKDALKILAIKRIILSGRNADFWLEKLSRDFAEFNLQGVCEKSNNSEIKASPIFNNFEMSGIAFYIGKNLIFNAVKRSV